MKRNLIKNLISIFFFGFFLLILTGVIPLPASKATKLYWFIPDGMRAEPDMFNIYKWAQEGKLPNIKKLMDSGSYGYSISDFPSHTPTNFASLLTGAHPVVHGVADGQMHIEGFPLDKPSVKGFASTAKKVAPIWKILEDAGKKVVLLSIPGSTPPELKNGITIRGRWAGWGADTQAIVFESKSKLEERRSVGRGFRLFFLGEPLTKFVDRKEANNWKEVPVSYSQPFEAVLSAWGTDFNIYIYDLKDDNQTSYDRVLFSSPKEKKLADIPQGEWSEWIPVVLKWQDSSFDSQVKFKVIKLWPDGQFRIRVFFNNINRFLTEPSEVAQEITEGIGPMVDFVDNWPQQLIYENEDKETFWEEALMSLDWHKKAVSFIYEKYNPDVFIQDTYTPNQVLESRWWHKFIDQNRPDYDPKKAELAWQDILKIYQGLDAIIGEAMKKADNNTLIILSSDHGIAPLYRQVKLNNLFAKNGWLKFIIDKETGEPKIDWKNTKVVYLKMAHIYINPDGLEGKWKRASGPAYERLRNEVIKAINELRDEDDSKPLVKAAVWEDAPKFFELPQDRVGDIVLQAKTGFQWWEEVSENGEIFTTPLNTGYKQATDPTEKFMWTPFIISGPGVKKGFVISQPIKHIDQMPTFLRLLNIEIPSYVQGRVVQEILK